MNTTPAKVPTTAPPYMWLHIGDYLRDTAHLTPEQHGCYLRLLMALWTGDGVLRDRSDVLAHTAGISQRKWSRTMSKVLLPFFQSDGVVITQKRLLIELRRAQATWVNAQAGGRAKARQTRLPFPASGVPTLSGASGKPVERRVTAGAITPELRALLDRQRH